MKLPWLAIAAVVLCVVFIAVLDLGYLSMSRTQAEARDRLESASSLIQALSRLQALMVDAETATRGYALVGRAEMLQPYYHAKAGYREELAAVGALVGDDSAQQKNLDALRGLVDDKWAILAATIDAFSKTADSSTPTPTRSATPIASANPTPSTTPNASPTPTESTVDAPGRIVMDAIRNQVADMIQQQTQVAARLSSEYQRGIFYTRFIVLAASLLALLALVALWWAMRRYMILRARADAKLRASEERYRILTEVAPQISWMADASGQMTFCNKKWIEYTGLTLQQTMKAGALSVVHHDDRKDAIDQWKRAIAANRPFEAEVRLRQASDGAYRWHLARAQPLQEPSGKPLAWFGAAIDIDDRKAVELALDQFNASLAEQVAERTATIEERSTQLKALNRHLVNVTEKERARLARELHDELGAHLSVAMMDLTMVSRRLSASDRSDAAELATLAARLTETLKATTQIGRRIVSDLRPAMLNDLGLAGSLDGYCVQFEETTGIQCERLLPDDLPPIVEEAGIAIFRIVQESLSNIVKYAKATRVRLALELEHEFLYLKIQDDGIGMNDDSTSKKGSYGLIGIRERAEAFGGSLQLTEGLDGRGTGMMVTFAWPQIALVRHDLDASAIADSA